MRAGEELVASFDCPACGWWCSERIDPYVVAVPPERVRCIRCGTIFLIDRSGARPLPDGPGGPLAQAAAVGEPTPAPSRPGGTGANVERMAAVSGPAPAELDLESLIPAEYVSPYVDGLPGHARGNAASTRTAVDLLPACSDLQRRVFGMIRAASPAGITVDELATALRMYRGTVAPRVTELIELGLVADSGKQRQTPRGKPSTVWVAR